MIDNLTHREKELLALWSQGLTNKQVAIHFGISENTVKNYSHMVIQKLDCGSIKGAIAKWFQSQPLDVSSLDKMCQFCVDCLSTHGDVKEISISGTFGKISMTKPEKAELIGIGGRS